MTRISENLLAIERKDASRQTKEQLLRLDMAERSVNFSEDKFKEFVLSLKQEDFICYPSKEDYNELKRLLSSHFMIELESIVLGTGSDSCISNVFQAISRNCKNVIICEPCFPMYEVYAKINNFEIRKAQYSKDFKLEMSSIIELVDDDTGLVVLANPNSPIGDQQTKENLFSLANFLESKGIVLLIDEAYTEFGSHSFMNESWNENVVLVKTLSKAYGSAGARIGFSVSRGELRKCLESLRQTFPLSGASIKWAMHVLQNYEETKDYVQQINSEMKILTEMLGKVKRLKVQSGNTCWIHLSHEDQQFLNLKLKEHQIFCKKEITLPHSEDVWNRICISPGFHEREFVKEIIDYGNET